MIHEGFVARVSIYQLRLKLPRDAFRQLIPKSVVKQLLLQEETFDKNAEYLMDNDLDDVWYFLVHVDDFYETFDKPKYTSSDVDPIKLSQALEKWFKKYKTPAGGLELLRDDEMIYWRFKVFPWKHYIISNGKLQLYT